MPRDNLSYLRLALCDPVRPTSPRVTQGSEKTRPATRVLRPCERGEGRPRPPARKLRPPADCGDLGDVQAGEAGSAGTHLAKIERLLLEMRSWPLLPVRVGSGGAP